MENAVQETKENQVGQLALITLQPAQYAAEVYAPFKKRLTDAIDSVRAIDYDIQTTKGLEVATKARRLVADIRIAAEKERKGRKEPITQIGKLLDSSYKDLEANILPLESLFDDDIKAEEKRKEEVKKEKERAEAARVSAIAERITLITKFPMRAIRKSSAEIKAVMDELSAIVIDDSFAEFIENARAAHSDAMDALTKAYDEASDAEAEAEAKRLAAEEETRKQARERAELAAKQAELERIANEQAAERKRLADEQAAIDALAAEQRRKAEENAQAEAEDQAARLKAEADAHAAKMQAEVDAHAAALKAQQEELDRQRAVFAAEQKAEAERRAAEQKAVEDAAKLESDHEEALLMNARFDEEASMPVVVKTGPIVVMNADISFTHAEIKEIAILEPYVEEPSDVEIVLLYMGHFEVERNVAIERLSRFALTVE